jgi:hypothetical protein
MNKIKNDPRKYVKRSDIAMQDSGLANRKPAPTSRDRHRDFMTAHIGEGFYIDFKPRIRPNGKR